MNVDTVRRLQIALKRSVGRKEGFFFFVCCRRCEREGSERASGRASARGEDESSHKRARLLLFAKGSQSFSGAERSERRNLSREIQVSFKKKPSDKRGFSRSLSVGGESGSLFSEEEQRRRVFGLLLKTGSLYLFVWIVVRRKRRTRKKVGLQKTKARKEFIHCRCLVPLVGGKPGDFETCQEEGRRGSKGGVLMDSKAAASTPATDVDVGKEENQPESSQSVKRAEMVRTTQSTDSSIGGVSTRESSDEEVPATETSIAPAKRTPFTSLTQVDADMALARALQEQERAYLLLRIMSEGNEFNRTGRGSGQYDFGGDDLEAPADKDEDEDEDQEEGEAAEEEEEEEEEENEEEGELLERGVSTEGDIDGSLFDSDEAFARALQEKEDRDTTARLMALAGIHDLEVDDESDSNDSEENMWQDVDPDNMSYEELIALGEAVGTESKGLSVQAISALPGSSYVPVQQDGSNDQEQCVVCRHEYEAGDSMLTLPCKHQYHSECIQQWLQINKVCPVCSAEVTFSPTTC